MRCLLRCHLWAVICRWNSGLGAFEVALTLFLASVAAS